MKIFACLLPWAMPRTLDMLRGRLQQKAAHPSMFSVSDSIIGSIRPANEAWEIHHDDARRLLPHLTPLEYPGQALAVALYEAGGIRSCEIGTVMFGRQPDGSEQAADMDLVRLAIPRRTYTQSHIDYVIEVCGAVSAQAQELPGYRIVDEPPVLRHFTARFEPLQSQ